MHAYPALISRRPSLLFILGPNERVAKRRFQMGFASHYELPQSAPELRPFVTRPLILGKHGLAHPIANSGRSGGAAPPPVPPGVPRPASRILVKECAIGPSGHPAPAIGCGSVDGAPRSDHRWPAIRYPQ
jgi:hypothetical protein